MLVHVPLVCVRLVKNSSLIYERSWVRDLVPALQLGRSIQTFVIHKSTDDREIIIIIKFAHLIIYFI